MQSMEEMMKAAQEAAVKIQQQMNDAQVKLDALEVEGAAGGGLVKVRAANAQMQEMQSGLGLPPGFKLPGM